MLALRVHQACLSSVLAAPVAATVVRSFSVLVQRLVVEEAWCF
jgi:hypothetical protein